MRASVLIAIIVFVAAIAVWPCRSESNAPTLCGSDAGWQKAGGPSVPDLLAPAEEEQQLSAADSAPKPNYHSYAANQAQATNALECRLNNLLDTADKRWQTAPAFSNSSQHGAAMPTAQLTPLQTCAGSPEEIGKILLSNFSQNSSGAISVNSNSFPTNSAANTANQENQALALLQQANDQAAQAESDASRAAGGSDRQGSASSAQYHANAARAAADAATNITYAASDAEKSYAAQAREAAGRAQSAADQASYAASL